MSREEAGRMSEDRRPHANDLPTLPEGSRSEALNCKLEDDPVGAGFSLIGTARVPTNGALLPEGELDFGSTGSADGHCVYAIQRVLPGQAGEPLPVGRAVGESTILYIGEGKANRPGQLFHGRHSANAKLGRLAYALGQKQTPEALHVRVWVKSCVNKQESVLEEARLLNQIAVVYGETPPCNARWEGWVAPRLLKALAKVAIAGSTSRTTQWWACPPYPWPQNTDGGPACTTIDFFRGSGPGDRIRDNWVCSLAWVWPASWHTLQDNAPHQHIVQPERLLLAVPPDHKDGGHLLEKDHPPEVRNPLGWTSTTMVTRWTPCPLVDAPNRTGTPSLLGELLARVEDAETPLEALKPAFSHVATDTPEES